MKKTRDKAAASAGAADLLYERFEGRIRARFADPDVARDVVTLGGMTEIYCADHHPESMRVPYRGLSTDMGLYPARRIPRLCPACAAHLRYGEARRALCTREPRPSCKTLRRPLLHARRARLAARVDGLRGTARHLPRPGTKRDSPPSSDAPFVRTLRDARCARIVRRMLHARPARVPPHAVHARGIHAHRRSKRLGWKASRATR